MERDLRLMLVDILATLKELLDLQKSKQKTESSDKEKQLLND